MTNQVGDGKIEDNEPSFVSENLGEKWTLTIDQNFHFFSLSIDQEISHRENRCAIKRRSSFFIFYFGLMFY